MRAEWPDDRRRHRQHRDDDDQARGQHQVHPDAAHGAHDENQQQVAVAFDHLIVRPREAVAVQPPIGVPQADERVVCDERIVAPGLDAEDGEDHQEPERGERLQRLVHGHGLRRCRERRPRPNVAVCSVTPNRSLRQRQVFSRWPVGKDSLSLAFAPDAARNSAMVQRAPSIPCGHREIVRNIDGGDAFPLTSPATMSTEPCVGYAELIRRLDRSVEAGDAEAVTQAVKADLEDILGQGALGLPADLITPRPDCYARRLLHRDPDGRYTAIVMTWGPGQGTAVHDHGGLWCVEGVVDGEIAVTQYRVDRKSTRLNSSHIQKSRMPSSA